MPRKLLSRARTIIVAGSLLLILGDLIYAYIEINNGLR